jgi:hypothetical protein
MSKRNNESTQQNRRIVRWSRRHVQSRRNVREDGRSSTQSDIGELSKTRQSLNDQNSVVVCRKPHILRQYYRQNGPRCEVLFFQTVITSGGISDVDGSVAAMKAHLEKYIIYKDPNTCIRCERVDKGSVAYRFANVCSKCYIKACYSSGSYDSRVSVGLICQTYRLSDPIAPHQSGSRLHDRHLTEDEGFEKDVHGRRHTGRQPYRL